MLCNKCGSQNNELARFCCICGKKLEKEFFGSNQLKTAVLVSCNGNKVKTIKEIRTLNGMNLAEAKELCEHLPSVLKKDISEAEAQQIKNIFAVAGAIVEIR